MRLPTSPPARFASTAALFTIAAGILHASLGPPDTHWNLDNGARALAVAHLIRDPGATRLEYPGRAHDPHFRSFPLPLGGDLPYAALVDGEPVSAYLTPFAWLVLPFVALLGFSGQGVLPAVGGGLAVGLTGALAHRRTGSMRRALAAAALAALASPLLFYSSVLWEHSVVVALVAGAFAALESRRASGAPAFGAGLLLGVAAFLREEVGLLVLATAIGLFAKGRRSEAIRVAAGGAVGIAGHFAFQRAIGGSWAGVHGGVNRPEPFLHTGTAVRDLLASTGASGAPLALVGLAAVALGAAAVWRRAQRPGLLALAGASLLAGISLVAWTRYPDGQDRALALIGSNSTVVFLPWALVVPFLAATRRRPRRDAPAPVPLGTIALLFLGAVLALAPERTITGVHPGPRLLLPLLPLVAALAAERIPARVGTATVALVIAAIPALLWNVRSLELLHDKRHASGRIAAAIAADPHRIVVTNLFWLPAELPALWFEREFHLVGEEREVYEALCRRAAAAGEEEVLLVVGASTLPNPPASSRTVINPGFPEFSVVLHAQRIGGSAAAPPATEPAPPAPSPETRP